MVRVSHAESQGRRLDAKADGRLGAQVEDANQARTTENAARHHPRSDERLSEAAPADQDGAEAAAARQQAERNLLSLQKQARGEARSSIPNAGFTPGPWRHGTDWPSDVIYAPSAPNAPSVATIDIGPGDLNECEANANLIAAAPELYEALQTLVSWNIKRGPFDEPLGESEQEDEINVAVAALRKARGEA